MNTIPAPLLEHVFTIVAEVSEGRHIGDSGTGDLTVIPIVGGTVTGRVNGRVLPGGADWAVLRDDGSWLVEARYQLQTEDGTVVDITNTGLALPSASPSEVPRYDYFPTRPVFRTGEPGLAWLTDRVFLGWGSSSPAATTIEVFAIEAPPALGIQMPVSQRRKV